VANMSGDDLADLRFAMVLLENPSVAARIANAVGTPVERVLALLPRGATDLIGAATKKSLEMALAFATSTMDDRQQGPADWDASLHRGYCAKRRRADQGTRSQTGLP